MFRRISALLGNSQRLDGGAMFGNAPKAMWSKWIEVDDQNRIPLVCRCLLVEDELPSHPNGRKILFETGIGAFFDPKLKDRYGVNEKEHVLLTSLGKMGLTHEDIDVVVLSHLHFDHAGGLLSAWTEGKKPNLLFNRAKYVVSERAWERALKPHPRDKASFIPELNELLLSSQRLEIIPEGAVTSALLGEGYQFHYSEGHTPGLLLTEVSMPGGPVVFAGDLVPGVPWVHVPITMGYDRNPELITSEKKGLLAALETKGGRLFFTHDHKIAMGSVFSEIVKDSHKYQVKDTVESFIRLKI